MKNIHIILFFALWVILGSCFTSYVSTKQVMGIHQGMPQQSVEKVLGRPDYRRFNGDMEEWEFHRDNGTPVLTSEPMTITVQFINKEVVGMDTFKGYGRSRSVSPVVMPPSVIVTNTPSVEESPRRRTLMMHDEFDRFLSDFRMVIMSDEQIKYIDDVLLDCNFTSAQCGKIIDQISGSEL